MSFGLGTRACILGCSGLRVTSQERRFFSSNHPLGFILFARNISTVTQVQALCDELRDCVGWNAPILIDQEGGRVQRLRPPLAREFLPPLAQCQRAGAQARRAMYLRFRIIAAELQALGIDVNCAPVADIARPDTHPFLHNRCYGETAAKVMGLARAAANGLLDGGVVPVIKHMPGHGLGVVDSHHALPQVAATAAVLEQDDFAVFTGLNDLPMAMTAHVVYAAYDMLPATVSTQMLGIMRNQIGFSGLIMTDDISMQALPDGLDARAEAAITAGCDVVLHCSGVLEEMIAVSCVVGRMGSVARQRAERALAHRNVGGSVDISNLDAQLATLVGKQADD